MDIDRAEKLYRELLEVIGEDVNREGLKDTPRRAAESLAALTRGYRETPEEIVGDAIFQSAADDMIIVRDIELYSMCEHHLLPFLGKCHVGYIPTGKVIGLSKIARLADVYSRRLQIQEMLTMQIAESVMQRTEAEGVGVVIEARHLCMMMRGVEKQNSMMTTSCMLGSFRSDRRTRTEFLSLIGKGTA